LKGSSAPLAVKRIKRNPSSRHGFSGDKTARVAFRHLSPALLGPGQIGTLLGFSGADGDQEGRSGD
jgi:hypothetical protein